MANFDLRRVAFNRNAEILQAILAAAIASGLGLGCGPPRSEEAARLINTFINRADFSAGGELSIPEDFTCGDYKYKSSGGKVSISGTANDSTKSAVVTIVSQINISGYSIFIDPAFDPSFNCTVAVKYAWDPTTRHMTGNGTVDNCDGLICHVMGTPISCEDLKTALPEKGCSIP